MRDLKHTSEVWPETNIISFQQFIHGLFNVRHVSRFVDAGREETRTVTLLRTDRLTWRCSLGHSPLRAAHHRHDQRQRETVKEPCFLGSPHPSCGGGGGVWVK